MKNDFFVDGDTVVILLPRRKSDPLYAVISLSDFPTVNLFPNTWCATWKATSNCFYVYGAVQRNGIREQVYLHRYIMDAPVDMVVDHYNHNGLINTRDNLFVVSHKENLHNRRGATSQSKSGIRGVSWDKRTSKWRALASYKTKEGKRGRVDFGRFDTIEEAAKAAERARELARRLIN